MISQNHLMKVIFHLARLRVIESLRGKGGGIRLRHAPSEIRLGQIVRASEGNSAIVECLSDEPSGCKIKPACRLAPILVRAFDALYQTLDSTPSPIWWINRISRIDCSCFSSKPEWMKTRGLTLQVQ